MTDKTTRGPLAKEDYLEPSCVLCGEPYGAEPQIKPVPQQRIIEKMDDYMSRRDYAGAERHLLYWLEEAKLGRDQRGELMIRGELVGHYRKTGEKEKAYTSAEEELRLIRELDFDGTVSGGTAYTNVATAYNAFGRNEEALALFEKARACYEANERTDPTLLGGLYNNMALVPIALGRFPEAYALYEKAIETMGKVPGGWLEQAITLLNLADAHRAEKGFEAAESEIYELLDRAYELFNTPGVGGPGGPSRGYYAFVCEKCAPTFSYYGYFLAAEDLNRRAKENYNA